MTPDRRQFLRATGSAFAALAAAGCAARGGGIAALPASDGYGAPVPDPAGLMDLPPGFSYRVLSALGDAMSDGGTVADAADGMGCFDLGHGELALVRNHELSPNQDGGGVTGAAYDTRARSLIPLPGGTTTLVLDARTLAVKRQYRTLAGTIRNCAGGITPWGSWLTCEENTSRANGQINKDHGYIFEVPATATGLVDPVPLTAMGRFNHEAACVDPATGIVYLTEDREDGLLYRFIPSYPGQLARGGMLQALKLDGVSDTRNWESVQIASGRPVAGTWVTLDNPEAPEDDLRRRGAALGAALVARGEGIWMGEGEMYFTATSGGAAKQGQVFRLKPQLHGPDALDLFYESPAMAEFAFGDNLTIAPDGELIVCEDQYQEGHVNHLRGLTRDGRSYEFAKVRVDSETAGACFSPDGRVLFVNVYSPTKTLAITGPWRWLAR